jgi:hypothetical protein
MSGRRRMISSVRFALPALLLTVISTPGFSADNDIAGTYRLISSTRVLVESGQADDSFGKNPSGYIMYGSDGRMMVLMVRSDRPKATFDTLDSTKRVNLFDSMAAYAGTYSFDGKKVVHHIDVSWNEILTGTDVVRNVEKQGRKLIYTTDPGPSPTDGKIRTSQLVWEKVD